MISHKVGSKSVPPPLSSILFITASAHSSIHNLRGILKTIFILHELVVFLIGFAILSITDLANFRSYCYCAPKTTSTPKAISVYFNFPVSSDKLQDIYFWPGFVKLTSTAFTSASDDRKCFPLLCVSSHFLLNQNNPNHPDLYSLISTVYCSRTLLTKPRSLAFLLVSSELT